MKYISQPIMETAQLLICSKRHTSIPHGAETEPSSNTIEPTKKIDKGHCTLLLSKYGPNGNKITKKTTRKPCIPTRQTKRDVKT